MSQSPNRKSKSCRYKRHTRYAGGIIRRKPAGTFLAEINRDKTQQRKTFATEEQAKAWIRLTTAGLDREGAALSDVDYRDAQRVRAMIPDSVSLLDLARFWTEQHTIDQTPFTAAVEEFLKAKERRELKSKSVAALRSQLGIAAKTFGERPAAALTRQDLEDYLGAIKSVVTRDNHRRALHNLFGWLLKRKQVTSNPVADIEKPLQTQRIPGILTPGQTILLLRAAERLFPGLVPYLALGLFAGVRPEELEQLQWSAIDRDLTMVHIGAEIAKLRQQRFITIPPNLKAWLQRYPGSGRVAPYSHRTLGKWLRRIRKAAGITQWPKDGLRHSYGSYHLALYKDAAATAHEMGNSPQILFKHYRQLVRPEQAARFFGIYPRNLARKCIAPQKPQ